MYDMPMYNQYNQDLSYYHGGAPTQVAPPINMGSADYIPMYNQYNQDVTQSVCVDTGVNNIYYNPYYQQQTPAINMPNSFPPQPNVVPIQSAPPYGYLQQNVYNPYMNQQSYQKVEELYKPPMTYTSQQPNQQETTIKQDFIASLNKDIPFGLPTNLSTQEETKLIPIANDGEGYKRAPEPPAQDKQQVFYSQSGLPYVFNVPTGQPQSQMVNPMTRPIGYMGSYYSGSLYQDPYAYAAWIKEQEEQAKRQRESDAFIRKKMLKAYYTIHGIPFTEEIEKEIDRQNAAYITPPPPPQLEQWEINQNNLMASAPYMVECTIENPIWEIQCMRADYNRIHNEQKRLNPDNIGVVEFFNEYAGIIETEIELLESKRQRSSKNAYYNKEQFKKEIDKAMLDESTYCNDLEVNGTKFYAPRITYDEKGNRVLDIKGPSPINGVVRDKNGDEWLNDTPTSMLRDREKRREEFYKYCVQGAKEYEDKLRAKGVRL